MAIDLKKMSLDELSKLIDDAAKERANRPDFAATQTASPPDGQMVGTPEPAYRVDIFNGLMILRIRSTLYGWTCFSFSKAAIAELIALLLRFTLSGDMDRTAAPAAAAASANPDALERKH